MKKYTILISLAVASTAFAGPPEHLCGDPVESIAIEDWKELYSKTHEACIRTTIQRNVLRRRCASVVSEVIKSCDVEGE